jgi:hypothetical protein
MNILSGPGRDVEVSVDVRPRRIIEGMDLRPLTGPTDGVGA